MQNSKIEWTDHTFNPWIGCAKVSPGCKNCYAETLMDNRYKQVTWGVNGTRRLTKTWKEPLKWQRQAQLEGKRAKVFCASLADVFEDREEVAPWRIELFNQLITKTPNLDWLLLTKRPEVAKQFFIENPQFANLPNVWLGVSVENQEQADIRISVLLSISAKIRFLSCEPLLGSIELGKRYLKFDRNGDSIPAYDNYLEKIDWVIVGGESGKNARPMHPDWVRSIQDQCEESGVAFFFKQWGEYMPLKKEECSQALDNKIIKTYTPPSQFDRRLMKAYKVDIQETDLKYIGNYFAYCKNEETPRFLAKVGKHLAGALLDGKEYREFPNYN